MIERDRRTHGLLHLPASREDIDLARERVWQRVRQGIREERSQHRRKAWLAGVSGGLAGFVGTLWVVTELLPRLSLP